MSRAGQNTVNTQPHLRKDVGVSQPGRVKPANLIYSVVEVPPLPLTITLGLQHVFVMSVGWIFVVVVATSIGSSRLETQTMIRVSMIASGLATILQAQTRGSLGRVICVLFRAVPHTFQPPFLRDRWADSPCFGE